MRRKGGLLYHSLEAEGQSPKFTQETTTNRAYRGAPAIGSMLNGGV